jgi:hypothetical protein
MIIPMVTRLVRDPFDREDWLFKLFLPMSLLSSD